MQEMTARNVSRSHERPLPGTARDRHGPVLVVGLARNCGRTVRKAVERISAALTGFERVSWLVIESDSTDDTVAQLASLKRDRERFDFESLGGLQETRPLRTDRIAHCRNVYLERLASEAIYRDVRFLVVADLDGVNELLSLSAVQSCFDIEAWDVCTANQRAQYYDLWALRHPEWMQGDCWRQYEFLAANGVSRSKALYAAVTSRFLRVPETSPPIEVDSAFGGFAIYRREAIGDARYVGLAPDGGEVCEHVAFHSALRSRGARIFINPRLINSGQAEHTRTLNLLKVAHWVPFKAWVRRAIGPRKPDVVRARTLDP